MTRPNEPAWDDHHDNRFDQHDNRSDWDDRWSDADDAFLRSALMTLRDDVDAAPLPEPAFVRARSGPRPRRRAIGWAVAAAAAVIAAAGIAFSQLGDPAAQELTPATTPSATDVTDAATDEDPTPRTTPSPSDEPTAAETDTQTDPATDPAPEETASDASGGPATVQAPDDVEAARALAPGTIIEPCGAVAGRPDLGTATESAAVTAMDLMDYALTCNRDALIQVATVSGTELSFGAISAEQAFEIEDRIETENRYELLSRLLTLPPQETTVEGSTFYRWPAEPTTEEDWQALIDAQVVSAEDRQLMEEYGSGYTGYRIVIGADGQWQAFLAGD